jgi:trehalose 6-phosphate phosphatase
VIPHALDAVDRWIADRERSGRILVALDFDGTLAPIAQTPEGAGLPARARAALVRLARRSDTCVAIVSGRALEDVREKVAITDVFYAGNHGLEISGPGTERVHPGALASVPAVRAAARELSRRLGDRPGVIVEDKRLTLSVHFRLVPDPRERADIAAIVRAVCASIDGLRATDGKMLVEVRPAVDWDKGRALEYLIGAVLDPPDAPVLFVGDDATDEDAFHIARHRGAAIVVADRPAATTAATHRLSSTEQVAELLERLGTPGEDAGMDARAHSIYP